MRRLGLAVACVALLAACNPSAPGGAGGSSPASNAAPGAFPNLFQTAYRAEATISSPEAAGQSMPVVMIRDGQKLRMEMTRPEGAMIVVSNGDTGESFSLINAAGRQMAMRMSSGDIDDPNKDWLADTSGATFVGPCSAAGETGSEWSHADAEGTSTGCVTSDGIILRATHNGQTTWETTSVQRGPQDPALFVMPAGVQVMDLSNLGKMKLPGQ